MSVSENLFYLGSGGTSLAGFIAHPLILSNFFLGQQFIAAESPCHHGSHVAMVEGQQWT